MPEFAELTPGTSRRTFMRGLAATLGIAVPAFKVLASPSTASAKAIPNINPCAKTYVTLIGQSCGGASGCPSGNAFVCTIQWEHRSSTTGQNCGTFFTTAGRCRADRADEMAKFTTFAEVLTPDHTMMRAYAAGITKKLPGEILGELLERSGGAYEMTVDLAPSFREKVRQAAELTSDSQLLAIANLSEIKIPLDHLRKLDPNIRIIVGAGIAYEPGESEALGLGESGPPDPKTTIFEG